MNDDLICGQLFGHGALQLSSHPEDYSEMRVYLGSSSSGEMNSAKEETYRIVRSLGAASNSRVITNVDHHMVGLLPNQSAASFTDACVGSFLALEVERDLLKVPILSLIEAVNFHAVLIVTNINYKPST